MAVRGAYTEEEKEMIADFEKKAGAMFGWAKALPSRVASEESIKNVARAVDCWNPLWSDENYAVNTRWGGIIAPPLYQDTFLRGAFYPVVPPSIGYLTRWYDGEDWDFLTGADAEDMICVDINP